jgi:hypothetical protein
MYMDVPKMEATEILAQKKQTARRLSFNGLLRAYVNQSRAKRAQTKVGGPAFVLNSKLIAHDFARRMGVRVPRIISVGRKLSQLRFLPNTFVKPLSEAQSRGVFYVSARGEIVYLDGNRRFSDQSTAKEFAKELLREQTVLKDKWMEEELIGGDTEGSIARDLKFYMFYGRVGLVLETLRVPTVRRCWYNGEGKAVSVGKYDDLLFEGKGNYQPAQALAQELSLAIPAPFVRIDFLLRDGDIYFGEITPSPSGSSQLNAETDARLGLEFAQSMTRLTYDLSYGKIFSKFNETIKSTAELTNRINAGKYYDNP